MYSRPWLRNGLTALWTSALCMMLTCGIAGQESAGSTQSTVRLSEEASLSDYLLYASLHNPALEAAFHRWQAALDRIPQAGVPPEPKISFGWYLENVETRTGPQEFSIGVSQGIPWLRKLRLMTDSVAEGAHAEKERYEAQRLSLFYQVKDIYYRYYYLGKSIGIVQENLALLNDWQAVLQTKYRTGTAQHKDLIKVQVELGKLEDHLQTLRELRGPIQAEFNAVLNRKADTEIPWPRTIAMHALQVDASLIAVLIAEANPEIRALHFEMLRHDRMMALADKQFFPDFAFGVHYIGTGDAVMPGQPGSGDDPVIASFSMTLPIWWSKYRAQKREAKNRYLSVEKMQIDLVNRLTARSRRLLFELNDAVRKVNLYGQTLIPKGEESLQAANTAYQSGQGQFLDLIDAERVLLEFQLAHEKALSDHERAMAELEMIAGQSLATPRQNKQPSEPVKE